MLMRNLLKSRHAAMQMSRSVTDPAPARGFAGGGPKKPPMPATETDFDVICVGKFKKDLKIWKTVLARCF